MDFEHADAAAPAATRKGIARTSAAEEAAPLAYAHAGTAI